LRSVVLPAPRKPDRTVTGNGGWFIAVTFQRGVLPGESTSGRVRRRLEEGSYAGLCIKRGDDAALKKAGVFSVKR